MENGKRERAREREWRNKTGWKRARETSEGGEMGKKTRKNSGMIKECNEERKERNNEE